jgi:hypothetical protein
VLVFSLVYWATGLARYVHERMEHETSSAQVSSPGPSVTVAGHDENDCPVCQVLATMRADQPVGPVVLVATFDLVGSYVPPSQTAPFSQRLFTIQSRGPPVDC